MFGAHCVVEATVAREDKALAAWRESTASGQARFNCQPAWPPLPCTSWRTTTALTPVQTWTHKVFAHAGWSARSLLDTPCQARADSSVPEARALSRRLPVPASHCHQAFDCLSTHARPSNPGWGAH